MRADLLGLSLAATTLVACDPASEIILPFPGDASSIFLAVRSKDAPPIFRFEEIESPPVLRPGVVPSDSFSIDALLFEESLEELGVPPGKAVSHDEPNRALPQATQLTLDVVDGRIGAWVALPNRPEDIEAFEIPAKPDACPALQVEPRELPGRGRITGITRIADERLLVTTGGDDAALLTATDTASVTIVDSSTTGGSLRAGVRTSDGRLWFARGSGFEVVTGTLDDRTLRLSSSTRLRSEGKLSALYVADPELPELFGLTHNGQVLRYDGTAWSVEHQLCEACTSGIVQIFDDDLGRIYFALGDGIIGRRDGTDFVLLTVPTGGNDSPNGSGYVPGLGLIAGTLLGSLLLFDGGEWSLLDTARSASKMRLMVPFADGFLAASDLGRLYVWQPQPGLCDPHVVGDGLLDFEHAERLGDAWVLGNRYGAREPALVVLVREG